MHKHKTRASDENSELNMALSLPFLLDFHHSLALHCMLAVLSRVAELEAKYPTPAFQNFRLRLLSIKGIKFGC